MNGEVFRNANIAMLHDERGANTCWNRNLYLASDTWGQLQWCVIRIQRVGNTTLFAFFKKILFRIVEQSFRLFSAASESRLFSARKVPIDDKRLVFCNGRIYWNSNMSHMFTQKLFQALFLCLHRAAVSKRIATPHLNECIDHHYYCRRDRSPALSIVENARYLRKSKRSIVCHALWPFPSIVLPCPFMSDLQYSNEWGSSPWN